MATCGLAASKVAKKLRCTKIYLWRVEGGISTPSADLVEKLAKLYGTTKEGVWSMWRIAAIDHHQSRIDSIRKSQGEPWQESRP